MTNAQMNELSMAGLVAVIDHYKYNTAKANQLCRDGYEAQSRVHDAMAAKRKELEKEIKNDIQ
jgi:hypothetical protein